MKKIVRLLVISILGVALIACATNRSLVRPKISLDKALLDPHVRAFLDTIAYAEGTLHDQGYATLYSGIVFNNFSDHPRSIIARKSRNKLLVSSAAGRYQILARIWDIFASRLNVTDFSPANQDRIALALIRQMGALRYVLSNQFEKALEKVSPIWASLPHSPYNQPRMKIEQLKKVYLKHLNYYQSLTVSDIAL